MINTDSLVETRPAGQKGYGLYAKQHLKTSTVIGAFGPLQEVVNYQDTTPEFHLIMPWDNDKWLVMPKSFSSPLYYLNHSCESNSWLNETGMLVARQDIPPDTEITVDYALFEHDADEVYDWSCLCGSDICRGTISGRDRLELSDNFMSHATPYVRDRHLLELMSPNLL